MTNFFKSWMVLTLIATAVACGAGELHASRAAVPPVIDGKLDDAAWRNATFSRDFRIMESDKPAVKPTAVAIVYTDNAIIFGFKAGGVAPGTVFKSDPKAIFDECVEVMLDPKGDSDSYYHFVLGANGKRFDRKCEQSGYVGADSYESNFSGAVRRTDDGWTAEIAIPFTALELSPGNGGTWSVNVARESGELSSLGEKGRFNVKGAFRSLAAPALDLSPFFWSVAALEKTARIRDGKLAVALTFKTRNLSTAERTVGAEAMLTAPSGKKFPGRLNARRVASDGSAVWNFPELMLDESGLYTARFMLRDHGDNRRLAAKQEMVKLEFVPLAITVSDPHYRHAIFATQKLDKVRFAVTVKMDAEQLENAQLTAGIRQDGRRLVSAVKPVTGTVDFEFPAASLPEGKMEIFAVLHDAAKRAIAESAHALRKLPYRQGEVWRGKDRNWYVDGKKVFLLAGWNNPDFHFPDYLAFMPNVGDWNGLELSPLGFGLTSAGIMPIIKRDGITPQVEAFFRERIAVFCKTRRLFGHYWIDEPDCSGMSREIAARVAMIAADADPYHPVFISTGTNGVIDYPDCGEINGFHCYPNPRPGVPMSNFMKIVVVMEKAKEFFGDATNAQTIAYLHQGFNYGDFGSRDSRIPSYEEYRNQDILALILGAQGLLHYNVFSGDYPELQTGMPFLLKEQRLIGEKAIIQKPLPVVSPAPELRLRAAENSDGTVWLLACNASYQPAEYTITLPPFGDRKLQVLSENRTVAARNGSFRDHFAPFAARVYTTDLKDYKLKNLAEIHALIEAEYAGRAKPGNLAWQRFEDSRLTVTASSNANRLGAGPASNTLWHVTDGVIAAKNPRGAYPWCDATPGVMPDWIELEFHQPLTVGRVVVYPEAQSLRDYKVQVWRDGKFVTVGEVVHAQGESQEVRFEPLETTKVRVYVLAVNGKNSKIREIEVYEK